MPDLLLELFSEEIPARMQSKAADELKRMITARLVDAGLFYEGATAFATPRRLALAVQGVPARQPDVAEEKRGPRVGAPAPAISGFLKSVGLASIEAATIVRDARRGDFYVARINKPGRRALDVIAEIVPEVVRTFPWPKSMRWGEGTLSWVRPLHSILATFGPHTEEPEIVPLSVDGIAAGDFTRGHRFMAPERFRAGHFDEYVDKLERARVVLDAKRRQNIILADARSLAFAQGLDVVEDMPLLAEAAGLVEWPVVLMGSLDVQFLAIPPEVVATTIRNNQKCFVLRDPQTARLANRFIMVANIEAADGGKAIISGNERVIRARLADAKFFWDSDRQIRLEDRLPKLGEIVFHDKLGTQAERVDRIVRLAKELARVIDCDPGQAERAARLCKADLVTAMVGEFPELQGVMGKYYAEAQGEDAAVAHAIEDHYRPQGPSDLVPSDPVSIAVALADKIDTLVNFWVIEEKPTGSKDPYALRRAALGVIRLIVDNGLKLRLLTLMRTPLADACIEKHLRSSTLVMARSVARNAPVSADVLARCRQHMANISEEDEVSRVRAAEEPEHLLLDLLSFLAERLKVQLREQGARHDLVDAVFALGDQDDLLLVVRRVEALGKFLDTEDGRNLLAGYKRATNIIRIEEKRDGRSYAGAPDPRLYRQPEEWALASGIDAAADAAAGALAREDFAAAMAAMAKLRPAVDDFFDHVTVNVDEQKIRENRLRLLDRIRDATCVIADFSRIDG